MTDNNSDMLNNKLFVIIQTKNEIVKELNKVCSYCQFCDYTVVKGDYDKQRNHIRNCNDCKIRFKFLYQTKINPNVFANISVITLSDCIDNKRINKDIYDKLLYNFKNINIQYQTNIFSAPEFALSLEEINQYEEYCEYEYDEDFEYYYKSLNDDDQLYLNNKIVQLEQIVRCLACLHNFILNLVW